MIKNFTYIIITLVCLFSLANISMAQPPTPTNLTSGAITSSSVVLNWTGAGSNDSYVIAWAWGPTAPVSISGVGRHLITDPMAETYTVTGLQAGQQMSFALFARNGGDLSTPVNITVTTTAINSSTFMNDQTYSLIIGQRYPEGDCNANDGGVSAHSNAYGYDVFSLTDPVTGMAGKTFIADTYNHRILIYNTKPTSNNQDADVVVGQSNFTSNSSGSGANQLNTPSGVFSDGTKLYVVDQGNNRVLVWNTIPTTNGASANIVLGQANFGVSTPNTGGRSASRMNLSVGVNGNGIVAYDIGFQIKLVVCDTGNDRVLIWNNVDALFNGAPANVVIGQTNFTGHTVPTVGGNNSTAATLYYPIDADVTSDGKLVIVSQYESRALIYNSIPTTNGASANNVLGQTNFSNNTAQSTPTSTSFYYPQALAISKFSNKLAIATSGYRVLIWNTFPSTNNAPAENVLGLANMTTDVQTIGSNQGGDGFTASWIRNLYGMSWTADGNLLIADGSRNAVIQFNGGDNVLSSPSTVTTGSVTSSSIELSWSGGAASNYYIYYRYGTTPPTSATDPLIANPSSAVITSGTSITLQDLPCGTQYSFAVFAEKDGQFAAVNGTVNAATSSSSCIGTPLVNGAIRQMVGSITGDTIFAVGNFTKVYSKAGTIYNRNNFFAFIAATGVVCDWTCDADAGINGICLDKATGKFYVGGSFNNIGGSAKKYLAAVNQDGSIITGFAPPSFSDMIGGGGGTCMTLNTTGDTLYFWGQFNFYTDADNNNFTRRYMAAVATADGSVSTGFNPPDFYVSNATCRFFSLAPSGRSLYVGSNNGGINMKSINTATGSDAGEFDFDVAGGLVCASWYDGSRYIYFGGAFDRFMGNTTIRRMAKVDLSSGTPVLVTSYNNSAATWPSSFVRSIWGTSTTIYMEGDFFNVGGTARNHIAAMSTTDASLTSFDPNLSGNFSNGTAGNLFVSNKLGLVFFSFVTAPVNHHLFARTIPISPSNVNGSSAQTVGAGATISFSNEGGPIAQLSTGTSNLGSTVVGVSGANGDTMSVNGFTVMERMLTVTPTTQPSDNVTVHFYVLKSEMDFFASIHPMFGNAGDNYSGCKVHRLGAANTYVQTFTPTITINGDIVDIAFDTPGFSSFVMSDDGVLPVELASFTSFTNKNTVTLSWRTVTETNNAGFDIERKKEGEQDWLRTGTVEGKGNSTVENAYQFEDRNVATGKYSYRLKQIDYNGNYEYFNLSGLVSVGVPTKYDLSQNYPNPFNPTTKINYDLAKDGFVKINIYDMTGRLISTLVETKQTAGYYTVSFNAASLSSGMYFYRIESESFIMTKKMVLIK